MVETNAPLMLAARNYRTQLLVNLANEGVNLDVIGRALGVRRRR